MNQKSIVIYKTWQINIPEDFITQLGIREGNTLSCLLEDNEIRLRPEKPDKAPIKYSTPSAASLPHASVSKHPMYQKEFHIQCLGSMSVSRNGEQIFFKIKKPKKWFPICCATAAVRLKIQCWQKFYGPTHHSQTLWTVCIKSIAI